MIIPDINLLVYAYNELAPQHKQAKAWWEELLSGETTVGVPWAVTFGFIRLLTHRQVLENPVGVEECCKTVEEWFATRNVQPVQPGSRHFTIFRGFLTGIRTGGNLVTDAHIAALAVEYSAELHSNDADFARFPGLNWVNPLG